MTIHLDISMSQWLWTLILVIIALVVLYRMFRYWRADKYVRSQRS